MCLFSSQELQVHVCVYLQLLREEQTHDTRHAFAILQRITRRHDWLSPCDSPSRITTAWEHCSTLRRWNDCSKSCFFFMRCTQAIIYYGFRNQTLRKYLKKSTALHRPCMTSESGVRGEFFKTCHQISYLRCLVGNVNHLSIPTYIICSLEICFWSPLSYPTMGENKSSPHIDRF